MPGPLEGITIIDCSTGLAGARATGLLADHGAAVTWVERPGGDPFRHELQAAYSTANRAKQRLELDLKRSKDAAELRDLVRAADVFVQSWRPGTAERLGVGREALSELNPALVYCSISGFGSHGPERDLPGYEAIVQARIGAMGEQVGYREGPIFGGVPFASMGAGYLASIGVLAALFRRVDDGIGRHVETSLRDGALAYLAMMWGDADDADERPPLPPGSGRLVARTFPCANGEYLGVHTGAVGAFGRLMSALGLQDQVRSSTTGVDMGDPLAAEELDIIANRVPEIFAREPRGVWLDRLLEADVCAIPALYPLQVFDEEQTRANEMVVVVDDPVLGLVEQVAPAARFPTLAASSIAAADKGAPIGPRREHDATGGILAGLKILDLGAFFAGPYSSRLLADLGADVIKLEPLMGDQLRGLERPFTSAQAGKRSISIDLKDPAAEPVLRALIGWADVVHHNMRPGAAERVGIGRDRVAEINPGALYLHTPGWGNSGPNIRRQSFEPLMSGYVGVGYEVAGQFNPPTMPIANGDPGNGMLGAATILMGLLHRARTGDALYMENPQLNATMAHMSHMVRRLDGEVLGAGRLDALQLGTSALNSLYATQDGWICVIALTEPVIESLAAVTGVDIVGDARFATHAAREVHVADLRDLLTPVFAGRTSDEWIRRLELAGVPAVVPVEENNAAAFLRDRANHASGRVAEVPHPTHGRVRWLFGLIDISHTGEVQPSGPPRLGEHTREILESLGFAADEIDKLVAMNVVRCVEPGA